MILKHLSLTFSGMKKEQSIGDTNHNNSLALTRDCKGVMCFCILVWIVCTFWFQGCESTLRRCWVVFCNAAFFYLIFLKATKDDEHWVRSWYDVKLDWMLWQKTNVRSERQWRFIRWMWFGKDKNQRTRMFEEWSHTGGGRICPIF